MKIKNLLFPLLALPMLFSSCNDNSGGNTTTLQYTPAELVMMSNSGSSQMNYEVAPNAVFFVDYDNNAITITLSGALNFQSEPITITDANNMTYISKSSVTTSIGVINDLALSFYYPWFNLSFQINGTNYAITTPSTRMANFNNKNIYGNLYGGNTVITTSETGSNYTPTEDMVYMFSFNKDSNTASIYFPNASFAAAMPSMPMVLEGVPYTLSSTGYVVNTSSTETFIPTAYYNGTYIEGTRYAITNINATIPFAGFGGSFSFECASAYEVNVTGLTVAVPFQ